MRLGTDKQIAPGPSVPVMSRQLTLAAGESRHIRARIDTTSSTTLTVALTLTISCRDADNNVAGKDRGTARNHEGSDGRYAITGRLPILADKLVTAPTAGTYTCTMNAWTASSATDNYHLTAVAGDTWLQFSDVDQAGSTELTNPACGRKGNLDTCTYLGAGTNTMFLFYNDGSPRTVWTASAAATGVDVAASYTVTTCYRGHQFLPESRHRRRPEGSGQRGHPRHRDPGGDPARRHATHLQRHLHLLVGERQ